MSGRVSWPGFVAARPLASKHVSYPALIQEIDEQDGHDEPGKAA